MRSLLIISLFVMLAGCGRVSPDQRVREARAYAARLAESGATGVDRFFLDHPDALLRPPGIDSIEARRQADSALATLTLEEKIGQLFIVDLPSAGPRALFEDDAAHLVSRHRIGGFLVPRSLSTRRVFIRTSRIQRVAKVPLFFAADYERGVGGYRSALTELPSNMALGATRDTILAAAAGRLTAMEARAIGINLLFAPVVDVNNNPENPIINIRSFGEDPHLVADMAGAFVGEAERYGLLTTLKHYPGHGNTSTDSHTHLGTIESDRAALDSMELLPYRRLIGGPDAPSAVMSAHLWIKAFEPNRRLPATMSRRALTATLRQELGFGGLIVTDDIKMGALRDNFSHRQRIIEPIRAGADIILTPPNVDRAIAFVREALEQGELTRAELDTHVRRILLAKARAGLFRRAAPDREAYRYLSKKPRGAYLAQTIADRAVTKLRWDEPVAGKRISLVQISNYTNSPAIQSSMDLLDRRLGLDVRWQTRLEDEPAARELRRITESASRAEVVVLALFLRLQSGRGEAGLVPGQMQAVQQVMTSGRPVIVVTFGNPYILSHFESAAGQVVAYDQSTYAVEAVARVLRGEQSAPGRLPISMNAYTFGAGILR